MTAAYAERQKFYSKVRQSGPSWASVVDKLIDKHGHEAAYPFLKLKITDAKQARGTKLGSTRHNTTVTESPRTPAVDRSMSTFSTATSHQTSGIGRSNRHSMAQIATPPTSALSTTPQAFSLSSDAGSTTLEAEAPTTFIKTTKSAQDESDLASSPTLACKSTNGVDIVQAKEEHPAASHSCEDYQEMLDGLRPVKSVQHAVDSGVQTNSEPYQHASGTSVWYTSHDEVPTVIVGVPVLQPASDHGNIGAAGLQVSQQQHGQQHGAVDGRRDSNISNIRRRNNGGDVLLASLGMAPSIANYLHTVGFETVSDLHASQMAKDDVKEVIDFIRQEIPSINFVDGIIAIRKMKEALAEAV